MEETISLQEIFQVIKKRFWMIVSFIVGAALIAAVVSYFLLTPEYEATSQFIVNQNQEDEDDENSVNDIWSNEELINTYNVIITSNAILDTVVDELDLNYSASALEDKIDVSSEEDSQVVNVTITDEDAETGTDIANTIVNTFQKEVPDILNVDNVSILSEAETSADPSPVSPRPLLNIAIAVVLGGMVGVGLAFLLEYLDNTIRTEDDVEEKLGLSVFGAISHMNDGEIRREEQRPIQQQNTMKRGGNIGTQKESV